MSLVLLASPSPITVMRSSALSGGHLLPKQRAPPIRPHPGTNLRPQAMQADGLAPISAALLSSQTWLSLLQMSATKRALLIGMLGPVLQAAGVT